MLELSADLSLLNESTDETDLALQRFVEDFYSDLAAQLRIHRPDDDPHSPASGLAQYLVAFLHQSPDFNHSPARVAASRFLIRSAGQQFAQFLAPFIYVAITEVDQHDLDHRTKAGHGGSQRGPEKG